MKGYDLIGPYGRKVFDETHKRHLAAMGATKRKEYARDQVKEIKSNLEERVLEVYFKNGELFKYSPNGDWY